MLRQARTDRPFAQVLAERTTVVSRVPPYRPGEFYLRELPPLRAVLDDLSGLGLLVAGGYAGLDPGGRPGLGAHAHAEVGIPVIGVAKSRFRTLPTRRRSCADPRDARCSSPPPGLHAGSRQWRLARREQDRYELSRSASGGGSDSDDSADDSEHADPVARDAIRFSPGHLCHTH